MNFNYDIIVIGAGHAGCEAATAAANLGSKTCLITMDMNKTGQMSCNPAMGGIAKGQIVKEIDALGGQAGIITDRTTLQFRMLNRSKGPAMWSPRAQCDREKFITEWRRTLENTPNLYIWQDTVREIVVKDNVITGVKTCLDVTINAKCVILTAGTFLNGLMHVGKVMFQDRRTQRALRGHGDTKRGKRLPPLLLHGAKRKTAETAQLLDMLHQPRHAQHTPAGSALLAALQRADTKHRSEILPEHRDEDCDLPRQGAAPAVSGA